MLHTSILPLSRYACNTTTKNKIKHQWIFRLAESRKLKQRAETCELYYNVLLNYWSEDRVSLLKTTLSHYEQIRPERSDASYEKIWEEMNDDLETEYLIDGCMSV